MKRKNWCSIIERERENNLPQTNEWKPRHHDKKKITGLLMVFWCHEHGSDVQPDGLPWPQLPASGHTWAASHGAHPLANQDRKCREIAMSILLSVLLSSGYNSAWHLVPAQLLHLGYTSSFMFLFSIWIQAGFVSI
jgi:hypothetical protein